MSRAPLPNGYALPISMSRLFKRHSSLNAVIDLPPVDGHVQQPHPFSHAFSIAEQIQCIPINNPRHWYLSRATPNTDTSPLDSLTGSKNMVPFVPISIKVKSVRTISFRKTSGSEMTNGVQISPCFSCFSQSLAIQATTCHLESHCLHGYLRQFSIVWIAHKHNVLTLLHWTHRAMLLTYDDFCSRMALFNAVGTNDCPCISILKHRIDVRSVGTSPISSRLNSSKSSK